jgi:Ca-activated chloride channel family protein
VAMSSVGKVKSKATKAIQGLTVHGHTALYHALEAARQYMLADLDQHKINAIILVTDGKNSPENAKERSTLLDQVNAKNLEESIRVFTISYGSGTDKQLLQQIARLSQASYYDATNPTDIDRVLVSVFSNF